MALDLPTIWAGLIAFAVLAYVLLDGFDLGVGLLFPFAKSEGERDQMMNSVAPVWDGNETWLVLGGGGLFAVFPLAYAVVMPALYVPIIAMLVGLIFRGVAFEFRWRTRRGQFLWDWAFAGGSLLAALGQGFALGALVQGIRIEGRAFAGGTFDWLTPFSCLTAVALVAGYMLLGATWLNMKTEGPVQQRAHGQAVAAAIVTVALIVAVSIWTPLLHADYAARWFAFPAVLLTAQVPVMVAILVALMFWSLQRGWASVPYLAASGLFVLCFVGIGISFHPYIVPTQLTIQAAAAPDESLAFLLWGAAVLVPVILAYTAYAYWVFRGKVSTATGYH